MSNSKGIDVGTNMLVSSMLNEEGNQVFKQQRDSFYRIVPKTSVNKSSIKMSLDKRGINYVIDEEGSFVIIGEHAIEIAIERNDKAQRPMQKGVISPKEKNSLPMLKLIIESLIGKGSGDDVCIYSVPANPIDSDFNVTYHVEMMKMYIGQMGYKAKPMNEAYAIAYSELLDEGLTGIAISCLVPGTKIYTDKGIVNIEDVTIGDKVITHKGRFKPVKDVIIKKFKGVCTKIQIQGYSDDVEDYKFVDNHELYVCRNNEWLWVGCEDLELGDIVGEPIIKQDLSKNSPTLTICERTTCSKEYTKKHIRVSPDVQRLVGYFLGDGSICGRDVGIQFDFHKDEEDNIKDVIDILKKNFSKKSAIIDKGPNCKRIECYSRGIARWFRKNCYSDNSNKKYPWDISRINKSSCLSLLSGLLRSDGTITDSYMSFYNTSTNLALLCKQLFSRLGIAASISYREPRSHFFESEDRFIKGTKNEWVVSTGKKENFNALSSTLSNMNCSNSRISERLFIKDGFCCSRVQNIVFDEYEGVVYDLKVEDDYSFSGPYLTIHNCGAGLTNICVVYSGDPLIEFSIARGGDFIDNSVGTALAVSPSLVQMEKEAGTDLYSNSGNSIIEAVSVYYGVVLNYVLENIAYELKKRNKNIPLLKKPVPIVFAGGLTQAKGFTKKVEEIISSFKFPLNIDEIRVAEEPTHTVANGCFLASIVDI